VKAYGRLIRVCARERSKHPERALRCVLVESTDGGGDPCLYVLREPLRHLVERARCGDGASDTLEPDAVEQAFPNAAPRGLQAKSLELSRGWKPGDLG